MQSKTSTIRGNFEKLCERLIDIDDSIRAAYLVTSDGQLIGESIKSEYKDELTFEPDTEKYVGSWVSISVAVLQNFDRSRSRVRYIVIGRDESKGMLIPLLQFGFILKLTVDKEGKSTAIYRKIKSLSSKLFVTDLSSLR